jgi:predicted transcriptional regulator
MTMTRISMDIQKEIQFLKPLLKSQRKIAKHLGINQEAVAKYWEQKIPNSSPNQILDIEIASLTHSRTGASKN